MANHLRAELVLDFAALECELLARRRFRSQAKARMACFSFIGAFYNPLCLHSALGYRAPITCEQKHAQDQALSR